MRRTKEEWRAIFSEAFRYCKEKGWPLERIRDCMREYIQGRARA